MRFYPLPTRGVEQPKRMQRSADSPDALNLRGKVVKPPKEMRRSCCMCGDRKPFSAFQQGAMLCRECEKPGSGERLARKLAREEALALAEEGANHG